MESDEELQEVDLTFDEDWINEAENEEKSFSRFYKHPVNKITCYSLFIDISKNLVKLNRQFLNIESNGTLLNSTILNVINSDTNDNIFLKNYRIEHVLNFNFDINQNDIQTFINDYDSKKIKNLYLKETSYTNDIKFNDTIKYLHPLNSLFLIYKQKNILNTSNKNKHKNKNKSNKIFEFKLNKHKTRKRL